MKLAPPLARLLARNRLDRKAIDKFLASQTFPLQHDGLTTFVYRGAADRVLLRHWIYGLPTSQHFVQLGDSDLWFLTLELPEESRIEYKIEVTTDSESELILDPLNALHAHDPFGANSVCHARGYETPEWTVEDPEARPGEIERHSIASDAFGGEREFAVYLPPRFRRSRRYPLLVVHDGTHYLRYAGLKTVLDNLIYRLEIEPLVVALTDSPQRLEEYAADPRHARFLTEELVPALAKLVPLDRRHERRGLMGASFGAVAALSTAWLYPHAYDRLLLQSGSFAFTDIGENRRGPAFETIVEFMRQFREEPGKPVEQLFISCGIYESLIYENRSMIPLFQATGMKVRYAEARDGHNWENWRDRLREGLSYLFPGPLWMVYE